MRVAIRVMGLAVLLPLAAPAATRVEFPPAIANTLRASCYRCHGENGSDSGNFGSILDADGLIDESKIIPGDADVSPLVRVITPNSAGIAKMPPEGPVLMSDEISALRNWINALPSLAGSSRSSSLPVIYPRARLPQRAATTSVLERHAGPKRDGSYVAPAFSIAMIPKLSLLATFSPAIQGEIYAQPLYVEKAVADRDILILATEANHVYALDALTGAILWDRAFGKPITQSDMPCGNIDPLGITGTPVVDATSGTVIVDAMEYTTTTPPKPRHFIHRLRLKDGSEVPGWGFDVGEKLAAKDPSLAFNALYQNQRGALTIMNGTVYVPYGGHWGDCGDYRGWVVGVPLASTEPKSLLAWKTMASAGGSWAAGGVSSAEGAVFFATGNTMGASEWGGGEAILRLPPDLSFKKDPAYFYTPSNWKALDLGDVDVGGVAPILIDLPAGAAHPRLAVGFGKDGFIYIVDRDRPGGIGGHLLAQKVARTAITVPTTYTVPSGTYVVIKGSGTNCPSGQSGDLTAFRITPDLKISTAWCVRQDGMAAPIVTTTDGRSDAVVWGVGAEGKGMLHAFNGETGQDLLAGVTGLPKMNGMMRFQSPIVGKDRLYVATQGRVFVYGMAR